MLWNPKFRPQLKFEVLLFLSSGIWWRKLVHIFPNKRPFADVSIHESVSATRTLRRHFLSNRDIDLWLYKQRGWKWCDDILRVGSGAPKDDCHEFAPVLRSGWATHPGSILRMLPWRSALISNSNASLLDSRGPWKKMHDPVRCWMGYFRTERTTPSPSFSTSAWTKHATLLLSFLYSSYLLTCTL